MVKIAVIADIHLTYLKGTVQYDAFEFALAGIKKSQADMVVCLGDVTADGDVGAAKYFLKRMEEVDIPKLYILGNSDIRTKETVEEIKILQTNPQTEVGGVRCIGVNTSSGELSDDDIKLLQTSDKRTLVFMHHPHWCSMTEKGSASVKSFQENGNYLALIHGHMHYYEKNGNVYSVQALDPDKAIGEPPCVTYFIVDNNEIRVEFDYFPSEMPVGMDEYLGLSCFCPETDIPFAVENQIMNIELRPSAVYDDYDKLSECVDLWRKNGGKYLSLHMPDFGYDGKIIGESKWDDAISFAKKIGVDGVTVHVPLVSLASMNAGADSVLTDFITNKIKQLPKNCTVGIENMHMTASEKDDSQRRFGYTPDECLQFMNMINAAFGYERAGLLLDVGHARNNAPYSEHYPIGAWYGEVGKYTVAYHIHQVTMGDNGMENHMPIKSLYGPLISYCGFAHCWNNNKINQKPLFLEIRGGVSLYSQSVEYFKKML